MGAKTLHTVWQENFPLIWGSIVKSYWRKSFLRYVYLWSFQIAILFWRCILYWIFCSSSPTTVKEDISKLCPSTFVLRRFIPWMKHDFPRVILYSICPMDECSLTDVSWTPTVGDEFSQIKIPSTTLSTQLQLSVWANSINLFWKRWFSGQVSLAFKNYLLVVTNDLLNWTRCIRNECSIEIKGSNYNETFLCFKKNQRSKVKRWMHRSCPPLTAQPSPTYLNYCKSTPVQM